MATWDDGKPYLDFDCPPPKTWKRTEGEWAYHCWKSKGDPEMQKMVRAYKAREYLLEKRNKEAEKEIGTESEKSIGEPSKVFYSSTPEIRDALKASKGSIEGAAKRLGMHPSGLRKRLMEEKKGI